MVVLQSTRPTTTPALDKKNVVGSTGFTYHTNGSVSTNLRPLIGRFVDSYKELKGYQQGVPVVVDGETLSIAAITAASRYGAQVMLNDSPHIRDRVAASRNVMENKVSTNTSVYGVSTGFGGSADTRTDQPLVLGNALLQHQHIGVLPSQVKIHDVLPLLDPMGSAMPESWVRGAMVIRMNSLIRGHSAVRWELIEKINELMNANITPMVPLRGSISASGDLSPLSYIAGTLIGNPSIRVFDGPSVAGHRQIVSSRKALADHGIEPISLVEKEPLGILNGTAFSASVASLALHDAVHLALLAQVCTAMGTEALVGTRGSYDKFIHAVARPHPGQVEAAETIFDLLEGSTFATTHEEEVTLDQDKGLLRQDRYPLRTAPQFLGPQIEDILFALETVTRESNSTTDNPLIDGTTGEVHHGGNFQAMAVSNAMEKTRLALHHIGKLLFSQCTELINPTMNRGLPPSMAATDPSLNYHTKGVDIATAAYVSELGFLANPVTTHIQSAEMHNQAVNSLALISARATLASLEILSMLTASYLYILCQALDLRAMQSEFAEGLETIIAEELSTAFGSSVTRSDLVSRLSFAMCATFDQTSTMDNSERMDKVAASGSNILIDYLSTNDPSLMAEIPTFRARVSEKAAQLLDRLRHEYLSGARGPSPASSHLNKTKPVYEHIRLTLGIRMHGTENYTRFANGPGTDDQTIGQNITLIHESIRDGKMQDVVASIFA